MTELLAMPTTSSDSDATSSPEAGAWIGDAGGFFLGAVLLFGAYAKVLDPLAFVEQIRAERLDFLLPAGLVAYLALLLEAGLGAALVLFVRRLWVLVPSALLVAFFLFLTGRTYYLDSRGLLDGAAGCGCFGNLVQRTPAEAFWQDLGLLVPGLLLAFFWRRAGGFPYRRTVAVVAIAVAFLVVAWRSPQLPLDDLATRLKPGVEVADLCTGSEDSRLCLATVAPELAEGRRFVVLADLDGESFQAAIPMLNQLAADESVMVLSAGTLEEHRQFFWQWGPVFEVVEAPEALLKPLYRVLPRSFEVVDGEVVATYSGIPDRFVEE